jgi:ketosteroid isomerase-like protein
MWKRIGSTLFLSLLIGLSAAGCHAPTLLKRPDRDAIETAAAVWQESLRTGDFDELARIYAKDAVLLPPNAEPIHGREAIVASFETFPETAGMSSEIVDIDGRGSLAYVHGRFEMKLVLPGVPFPVLERGKYMEIWRKGSDGIWRITYDMYSSDLPAAEE